MATTQSHEPDTGIPALTKPQVTIFQRLLDYPELMYELASKLDVDTLVNLYAISKSFRRLVNLRFTGTVQDQIHKSAPDSGRVFHWKCYSSLSQRDPALRPLDGPDTRVRDVPTFRWLRMVLHRENVVQGILMELAKQGIYMPKSAAHAIRLLWFMMDIPDSSRRALLIRNPRFWTSVDLINATLFMVKLDMYLTHPVSGSGTDTLRRMLLAQRTMTTLLKVMRREELYDYTDLMRMYVEWSYTPAAEHAHLPMFGVKAEYIGRMSCEGWTKGRKPLVPIDVLIMHEGVRRKLGLYDNLMDLMMAGFIDPGTGENTPAFKSEIKTLLDWFPDEVVEWEVEDNKRKGRDDDGDMEVDERGGVGGKRARD